MSWCVVRKLENGGWHLVSAVSFPTQARAYEHLEFVRASVRKGLRGDYCVARVVVDDPARDVMPVRNQPVSSSPLFDWQEG